MRPAGVLVVAVAVLGSGCLVQIDQVADPRATFRTAHDEALRLAGPGRPHQLNLLVYEPEERKLVRVSLPLWLVRSVEGHIDLGEGDDAGIGERLRQRLRMEDLEAAGRGILVEAEEDSGEQVLIWLR